MVLRAVAALVAFVLAAGVALLAQRLDERDDTFDGAAVPAGAESRYSGGDPPAGTDVPSYVTTRRGVLDGLEGEAVAVVSFDGYHREAEARSVLADAEVRALLVAARGGRPIAVTGSLAAWEREERVAAEGERESLLRLVDTTEDPAFVAQYRDDVARLAGLLRSLDPKAPVVFGAVVEADADRLRQVAGRREVRLVDPVAARLGDADVARLVGLRPEETARAGEPPTRPL